ncbi:MAG: L-aspartate oxidase [Actinomycetota bacterium]|nr:L-aspartate oxidase [Actinomycetota bacterium]
MNRGFDRVLGTDVVVVGSGVAGLTTALAVQGRRVVLVNKGSLGDGSTWWAQGGVAAPISEDDSPDLFAADTIAVGGGLNDPSAVATLSAGAVAAIDRLRGRGARFDMSPGGGLDLGREAGHSVRRIVRTGGDATGAEVSRALTDAAARAEHITVVEQLFVADVVLAGGHAVGVTGRGAGEEQVLIEAAAVVMATGGLGRIYANTTNPIEVTGDGLAMARRAGAKVADVEFVQFHPTALSAGLDPMPLLTEALRGEGAVLVDDDGVRFMVEEHRAADLAPRDVVARAVWRRLRAGRKVYLDARDAIGEDLPERFPTVFATCTRAGIDPRRELMPVEPAAHYLMGGVAVDLSGRTSVPGLWAVGEVSRSGVHGANRLASNSLLEGLVFAEAVADDVAAAAPFELDGEARPPGPEPDTDLDAVSTLRRVMWDQVGLVRTRGGLTDALATIEGILSRLPAEPSEARNMAEVAFLVTTAASTRTESRGAHYRADFPLADPQWDHSLVLG